MCTSFNGKHDCYHPETLENNVWNLLSYAIIPSSNPDSPLPDHFCDLDFGDDRQTFGNYDLIDLNNYYLDLKVMEIQERGKALFWDFYDRQYESGKNRHGLLCSCLEQICSLLIFV